MDTINNIKRTHYCGEVTNKDVKENVTIMGWVQKRRILGGLLFLNIRDREGTCQAVFNEEENKELFEKASSVRSEYTVAITGEVKIRQSINKKDKNGDIEIIASDIKIFSKSLTPPFEITEDSDVKEEVRLKYRYLDLRRANLTHNLMMRHKITHIARDFFNSERFLEIETPMLQKSTPEGARDYLVPSRIRKGSFYALPQSPQLYKQLLMVSGFDRYMQIVKCFRDEDLRADRQPEFTQIDLEMSFVNQDDVIDVNERFMKRLFKETLDLDIKIPFERMPYKEAMDRFGSDKPDVRFGFELCDISKEVEGTQFKVFSQNLCEGHSVRAICAKGLGSKIARREIDNLTEFVKTYKAMGLAYIKITEEGANASFKKFVDEDLISKVVEKVNGEKDDIIFIVADKDSVVYDSLGALRLEIAKRYLDIKEDDFKFLWVTEFPLFEYSETEKRLTAKHHPFTSPMDEDIDLFESAPEKMRAKAYDMVLNGQEIGGGSIRIFDEETQEKMFKALGFTKEETNEKFGFLIEAFKYGVPPHGGLAFGLDRLTMSICNLSNIRDSIAFPKVQNASEIMSNCPDIVDNTQLLELGIKIDNKED